MNINVLNSDGTVSAIPGVKCRPTYSNLPESLWISKTKLLDHYKRVNKFRKDNGLCERDLTDVIKNIACAEASLEIYDSDEDCPWEHNKLPIKKIPYRGKFITD